MRKILFLMAMLVCSLQFAMAGDVVTRDVNKLPVAAREMIGKHFSQTKVAYIKIEKDLFQTTSYDVKLGLSGNFWLVSFKISYLCLPLFYETRTTPSCHPSGCAYRQL